MEDVAVTALLPLLRALIEEPPQPERLRTAAVEVLAHVAEQLATEGIAMVHARAAGSASVLLAVEAGGEALDLDEDWSEHDWDQATCLALVARLTERAPDAPSLVATQDDVLFVAFEQPQKPDGTPSEVWAALAAAAADGDWRPGPVAPRWRELLATLEPFGKALDENVQFTVYRPASMPAMTWQPVLAFAHLAEAREQSDPDPLLEVRRQAEAVLGPAVARYRDTTDDSRAGVPRESDVTMRLELPGCEINPAERSFRWVEDVHREEFRLRAPAERAGKTLRGNLIVFAGCLLLADVPIAIAVLAEGAEGPRAPTAAPVASSAARYRRVFASYSRDDEPVVATIEKAVETFGDAYLRDVRNLRAGEKWDPRLLELIEQADVFQLFWSNAAMRSAHVRREWEHALSLNRPAFVRPTFWETPFPEDPDAGLPPDSLRALHFHALPREAVPIPDDVPSDTPPPPPPASHLARARRRLFAVGGTVAGTVGAAAIIAVLAGSGSSMTAGNAARDSLKQFSDDVAAQVGRSGARGDPAEPPSVGPAPGVSAPSSAPSGGGVTTGSAVAVSATQATLTGTVEPGYASDEAYFEIGLTDDYGLEVRAILVGKHARATVDDLVPGSTYHYRLVVADGLGAVDVGEDQVFTTRR